MNILVIGGTRFIGAHAVAKLARAGHTVTVFHRGKHNADLVPDSVEHIHGNRLDLGDFREQFLSLKVDVLLDTIAMNEQFAQTFIDTMQDVAPRVVVLSSGDVYRAYDIMRGYGTGPLQEVPIREDGDLRTRLYPYRGKSLRSDDDPHKHMDFYDKIPVERILSQAFDTTILRLPAVYGPGDHRPWGYLKKMLDGRSVILLGEESAHWRFIRGYIDDIAEAIVAATANASATGRIYNVGDGNYCTEREWVESIAKAAGWKGEIRTLPEDKLPDHLGQLANPAQDLIYDVSRIRKELGWEHRTDLNVGMKRTVDWARENPPEEYDQSIFDYDAEDRALASALKKDN